MAERVRRRDWGGIADFLALLFFSPVGIGRFVLWGATAHGARTEQTGWLIVLAIFFTIPVIIVGLLLLREIGGVR